MAKLPLIAYLLVLLTSFTGGLTAGLGQGFDLGTEWPGALYKLLGSVASGSFEPIHRFSTVTAGVAVVAAAVRHWKRSKLFALGAVGSLVATVFTGRVVLLTLGGEVPPPWSYLVYPLNNFLAFLTAFFVLALAVESLTWRRRVLLRGVAFWSIAASLSGAYMLGVHKIERAPFQYQLSLTPESAPLLLHITAGAIAVILALAAALYGSGWMRWALFTGVAVQSVSGVFMYLGALENTWAPGPQVSLHTAFAHVMATVSATAYLKSRRSLPA